MSRKGRDPSRVTHSLTRQRSRGATIGLQCQPTNCLIKGKFWPMVIIFAVQNEDIRIVGWRFSCKPLLDCWQRDSISQSLLPLERNGSRGDKASHAWINELCQASARLHHYRHGRRECQSWWFLPLAFPPHGNCGGHLSFGKLRNWSLTLVLSTVRSVQYFQYVYRR